MNRDSDFKLWEKCNIKIWKPILDLEIDRIVRNRHNCAQRNRFGEKNHENTVKSISNINLSPHKLLNLRAFSTASISHELALRRNQSDPNKVDQINDVTENASKQHIQNNGTANTSHYDSKFNVSNQTEAKNVSHRIDGNVQLATNSHNQTDMRPQENSQQITLNKSLSIEDGNRTSTGRPVNTVDHHFMIAEGPATIGEKKQKNKASVIHKPRRIATPGNISRNLVERKQNVDQVLGNLSLLIHTTKITNLTDLHNITTVNTDILRKNKNLVLTTTVPGAKKSSVDTSESSHLGNNISTVEMNKVHQSIPIHSNYSKTTHIKGFPRKIATGTKNMIGNNSNKSIVGLHPSIRPLKNDETFGQLGDIMRDKLKKVTNENIKLMPLNGTKVFRVNGKQPENENSTHWTVTLKISGKYDHNANVSIPLRVNNFTMKAKNSSDAGSTLGSINKSIQASEVENNIIKTSTSKVESKQSVHDQFLELKKKFGAENVHEVIVIGHHTDGDDLVDDHDGSKKHSHSKSDGRHDHNEKKISGFNLSTMKLPESLNQDDGKNADKGVSNRVSDMIRKEGGLSEITASITTEISESDRRDGSKHFDEHYEHRDLLIGLNEGDVVHIDSGKTSAENSRWKL